jgi:hypothetical protein
MLRTRVTVLLFGTLLVLVTVQYLVVQERLPPEHTVLHFAKPFFLTGTFVLTNFRRRSACTSASLLSSVGFGSKTIRNSYLIRFIVVANKNFCPMMNPFSFGMNIFGIACFFSQQTLR